MTHQERDLGWIGVMLLGAAVLAAEVLLVPMSVSKVIVSVVCVLVIGYGLVRPLLRRRRGGRWPE